MIFRWAEGFEAKVFTKHVSKLRIFDILQIRLNLYFQVSFYVCFNIFTSTCRASPLFYWRISLSSDNVFYMQNIPLQQFFAELWSKSFRLKRGESQNFRRPQNPIWPLFLEAFFTFASKRSSSAKNCRRGMFCIWKTLSELSAIRK